MPTIIPRNSKYELRTHEIKAIQYQLQLKFKYVSYSGVYIASVLILQWHVLDSLRDLYIDSLEAHLNCKPLRREFTAF